MEKVIINDVGPRDGLQNESATVTPHDRVALINALVAAGVPAVEVASFVSPQAVPKMVGASEVVASLDLDRGVFSSLVPNYKGYELAKASGIRSVAVVLSATETMNVKNINMGLDKTIAVCSDIVQQARKDGLEARAYLSVALGCPYEGPVAEEHIESLGHKMFDAGAAEVIVADTIGAANPSQVKSLFNRMCTVFGSERLSAHFHDTRALALANAWQALECGIRKFDASIGGLGGCPFAPGSAGNLATEDLATMLEQTGFETGVNVDRLLEVVELVRGLVGHDVGGRTLAWLIGKRSAD
jgi:hydroxymethylglutaryl-CoA lyase